MRRRIPLSDRQAGITTKVLHNLIVVAASRGFWLANENLKRQLQEPEKRSGYHPIDALDRIVPVEVMRDNLFYEGV